MGIDEYFTMVMLVLMGLTLIAFCLVFLYMMYGEKEESTPSPSRALLRNIAGLALLWLSRSSVIVK